MQNILKISSNDNNVESSSTSTSTSMSVSCLDSHTPPNNERNKIDNPTESKRSQRARKEKNLGPDFISSQVIDFFGQGTRNEVFNTIPILLNIADEEAIINFQRFIQLFGKKL